MFVDGELTPPFTTAAGVPPRCLGRKRGRSAELCPVGPAPFESAPGYST